MINNSTALYGDCSENRMELIYDPKTIGARMLVESFYYAFNHRNVEVLSQVWAKHKLVQLNNPLGGILRGYEPIDGLYNQIFNGPASVWVEFSDVVEFQSDGMVAFAGRETGEFTLNNITLPLSIRTSRIVKWFGPAIGWRQVHHHGSIDSPELLEAYQSAVYGK